MSDLTRRDFLRMAGMGAAAAFVFDVAGQAPAAASSSTPGVVFVEESALMPAASALSPWRNGKYVPRPGQWKDYLLAPRSRLVRPAKVLFSTPREGAIQGDPSSILQSGGGSVTLKSVGERTGSPLLAVDFGQEVGGKVVVRVIAASGQLPRLHVSFSESLDYMALKPGQNGGQTQYAPGSDTANYKNGYPGQPYTWDSDSHEVIYADHQLPAAVKADQLRGGFRYATIFLDGPGSVTLDSLALEFVAAPRQEDLRDYKGHFLCSDNLLNKIWYAGAYTLQLNTARPDTLKGDISGYPDNSCWPYEPGEYDHANNTLPGADPAGDVLLDGAKRDRDPFAGDLAVQGPVVYLSTNDRAAVSNTLSALAKAQQPDGYIPGVGLVCPSRNNYPLGSYDMWFLHGVFEYYLYTGDVAYMLRWYPALIKTLNWLQPLVDETDLLSFERYAAQGAGGLYGYASSGHLTYVNSLYHKVLRELSVLASVAGDSKLSALYQAGADKLGTAINRKLWDDSAGAYRMSLEHPDIYPQDAQAMAILAGVADKRQADRGLAFLKAHNWAKYGSLTVPDGGQRSPIRAMYEPFPSGFEVDARLASGDTVAALELIRRFWGYQLSKGPQSTVWEKVSPDGTPGIQQFTSLAHGWAAGPTVSLTTRVLGVRPTAEGFSRYEAIPHPGDVSWAEGKVPTPHGPIEFHWAQKGRGTAAFTARLKAPEGTTGRVGVPTFGRKIKVSMDGQLTWDGEVAKSHGAHSDGAYVYLEGIDGGLHELSSESSRLT